MKLAFKVVRGFKVFRPATQDALQKIRYRIGEITIQGGEYGPFAVFTTLRHAKNFKKDYGDNILLCLITESSEYSLWKRGRPSFYKKGKKFIPVKGPLLKRGIGDCPRETILAKMVTPIVVINEYDPDEIVNFMLQE